VRVNESGEDELASKKRKKETQYWKRVVLKDRLNKSLEYISSKGQKIAAKTMKEPCGSSCRFKCSEKFTKEVRQNIFNSFYELGDKTRQWDFIARHVVTVEKKNYDGWFFTANMLQKLFPHNLGTFTVTTSCTSVPKVVF
jgi:hypothetical protein